MTWGIAIALLVLARPPQTPTATVAGRVLDDRGTPVGGASVVLVGGPGAGAQPATTTEDGRFALNDIPPAIYTIAIAKAGYPAVQYGQPRPGTAGSPVPISAGDTLTLDLRLPRGAVIAGLVVDDSGEPLAGRRILVTGAASSGPWPARYPSSNFRGEYRLFGLAAGTYRVGAAPANDPGGRFDPPEPVTVVVAAGDERDGIDLHAPAPVKTTSVIIVPVGAPGQVVRYAQVALRRPGEMRGTLLGNRNPDESTTLSNVPAGTYKATVHAGAAWGVADVVVDGEHPITVRVPLVSGKRVTGRVTFSGTAAPPVRLSLYLIGADPDGVAGEDSGLLGQVAADGTFAIGAVPPGKFLINLVGAQRTDTWTIQSARIGDLDAADVPFTMGVEDVTGVTVTVTDARTTVRGTATRAGGMPANGRQVILYPADPSLHVRNSRRIATALTSIDGGYEVKGLPPGTYAIAVADGVDREALRDPAVLARLEPISAVTLAAGEPRVQDLIVK